MGKNGKVVKLLEKVGGLLTAVRGVLSQQHPDQGQLRDIEPINRRERFGNELFRPVESLGKASSPECQLRLERPGNLQHVWQVGFHPINEAWDGSVIAFVMVRVSRPASENSVPWQD